MAELLFCDGCDRSLAVHETVYRGARSERLCAQCHGAAARRAGRQASSGRRRARLLGRLSGIAVLVLLGWLAHGRIQTELEAWRAGKAQAPSRGGAARPALEEDGGEVRAGLERPGRASTAAPAGAAAVEEQAAQDAAPPDAGQRDETQPTGQTIESPGKAAAAAPAAPRETGAAAETAAAVERAGEESPSEQTNEQPSDQRNEQPDVRQDRPDEQREGSDPDEPREPAPPATAVSRLRFAGRYAARPARRGGTAETRRAVDSGLDWLMRHQSASGGWSAAGFEERCSGVLCGGAGDEAHDVGVTGLALLAFLAGGNTADAGDYKECVRRGLEYLVAVQDPRTGCFGKPNGHRSFLYDHAIAAQAMVEGYGLSERPYLAEIAQAGIDTIHQARNPHGAWRYFVPPNGESDTSVTGWMAAALAAALDFGLDVDPAALAGGAEFVRSLTDETTGRTGYYDKGGTSSREPGADARWPPHLGEAMTAAGILVRIAAGENPLDSAPLQKSAALVAAKPPVADPDSGRIDYYAWYQGTYALHAVGGAPWEAWEPALRKAALALQRGSGEARGSFDPQHCPWGGRGGRVYATAMLVLCLEVYDRFRPGFAMPSPSGAGLPALAASGSGLSEALAAALDEYQKARGDRSKLMKSHGRLFALAPRVSGVERALALLYAAHAQAEAGELEPARRARDRTDKFQRATLILRDVMAGETDVELDGESAKRRAARLRLKLHEECVRAYEARRASEAGYTDFDFKNDTGYHLKGIEECKALLGP